MRMAQHVAAWAKSGGPEPGFVPVEFVSFVSPVAYFDIPNFIPPDGCVISFDMRYDNQSSGYSYVIDTNQENTATQLYCMSMMFVKARRAGLRISLGGTGHLNVVIPNNDIINFHSYKVDYDAKKFFLDGNPVESFSKHYDPSYFQYFHVGHSTNGIVNSGSSLKNLSVVKNGISLLDVIPYRDNNNNAFLYDSVSGNYYGVTDGIVTIGPDKT